MKGKVKSEAEEEADGAIAKDNLLDHIYDANRPVADDNGLIVRDAHGVVGVCSPW